MYYEMYRDHKREFEIVWKGESFALSSFHLLSGSLGYYSCRRVETMVRRKMERGSPKGRLPGDHTRDLVLASEAEGGFGGGGNVGEEAPPVPNLRRDSTGAKDAIGAVVD